MNPGFYGFAVHLSSATLLHKFRHSNQPSPIARLLGASLNQSLDFRLVTAVSPAGSVGAAALRQRLPPADRTPQGEAFGNSDQLLQINAPRSAITRYTLHTTH